MPSLWEVLKTSKGLPAPDGFTALFARSLSDTYTLAEISGIPPLNLGEIVEIVDYTIYGNTYQAEGVSPDTPQKVVGCGDFDEPYGYKIPVECRGKNLIDYTKSEPGGIDASGNLAKETNLWRSTVFYPIDSAELMLSFTAYSTLNQLRINYYDETYRHISRQQIRTGSSSGIALTIPQNARYFKWTLYALTGTIIDIDFVERCRIMLNVGTTAEPYEPYHEPITTAIYLDKSLYKIGNYTDVLSYSGKSVERPIKELILTGDENFQKNNAIANSHAFALYGFDIPYISKIGLCTHLPNSTSSDTTGNSIYFGSKIHLCFDLNSEITTGAAVSAWLKEQYNSGTPVKVYYVLAAPVTETVELPEIPTLDGTTVIDVDTEVKPSNLKITYKSRR